MPQHCATMQNSALDAALGAPQMRYRGREQHEESSLLECEPMPRPGKGLRRHHRPLICYMSTHHVD